MGAGQSAAAHVCLDKAAWAPGEPITGCVFFHAAKPVHYTSVTLTVSGEESCHWEEQKGSGNDTYTQSFDGKRQLIKARVDLLPGPGDLGPGGHQLPFLLSLPAGLPPSYEWHRGRERARVEYKVKAKIDQAGTFARDFKAKAILVLLPPPPPPPPRAPRPLLAEGEGAVRACCCCWSKGRVALRFEAPGDAFCAGQAIQLAAQANNASSAPVAIEASLVRVVRLKAHGGSTHRAEERAARRWLSRSGAGAAAGAGAAGGVVSVEGGIGGGMGSGMGGDKKNGKDKKEKVLPGQAAEFRDVLPLDAEGLVPTATEGLQTFQIWYELRLAAVAGGCSSSVRAAHPVLIYEPPASLARRAASPAAARPAAPEGWAPAAYKAAGFAIGADGAARRAPASELFAARVDAPAAAAFAAPPQCGVPAAAAGDGEDMWASKAAAAWAECGACGGAGALGGAAAEGLIPSAPPVGACGEQPWGGGGASFSGGGAFGGPPAAAEATGSFYPASFSAPQVRAGYPSIADADGGAGYQGGGHPQVAGHDSAPAAPRPGAGWD